MNAIVATYEESMRRIIGDKKFVALSSHRSDAKRMLPDLRALVARVASGVSSTSFDGNGPPPDWRPTVAQVVAHKLETYLRDPRAKPWPLRWLLDRTEQDDLPRPKAKAREPPRTPEALPARSIRKPAPLTPEEQKDLDELKQKLKGVGNGPG